MRTAPVYFLLGSGRLLVVSGEAIEKHGEDLHFGGSSWWLDLTRDSGDEDGPQMYQLLSEED